MLRMKHALPPLTQHRLEAFAASAALWLIRLLGAALHPGAQRRRKRLAAFVARIERFVEHVVFLKAVHAAGPPPPQRHAPASTPLGFRRLRRRPTLFWKLARIRAGRSAGLVDRIVRLFEVLARPAPYVARVLKQLCKGLRLSRLVPIAPPAAALAADAPCAVIADDTS